MEALDRYLQAVEFWLPGAGGKDIVAELSEDIRAELDDRAATLGRALSDDEVREVLARRGHPLVVAERFLPPRHLIGPTLFPLYRMVLRGALLFCLLPLLMAWLGPLAFDPAARAAADGLRHLEGIWLTAVYAFAFVTVAFALLERFGASPRLLASWDPTRLPAPGDPSHISRAASVLELAVYVAAGLFFVAVVRSRVGFELGTLHVTLAPAWPAFAWAFGLASLAGVLLAGANLYRPVWTAPKALARLVVDGLGFALCVLVCRARPLAGISAPGLPPERAAELVAGVNRVAAGLVPGVIAVGCVVALFSAYRIVRLLRKERAAA